VARREDAFVEAYDTPYEIWARGSQSMTVALVNGRKSPEIEANARLIAAAPTMYDFVASKAASGDTVALVIMEMINGHAKGN